MPAPQKILRAEIRQIRWDSKQNAKEINRDKWVNVQFNPESLKVSYSNQSAGGDQRGGSAIQFVGAGTTKLSLELWFDVTGPLPAGQEEGVKDVRKLTEKITYFITPKEQTGKNKNKYLPPGVRFIWGTFLFDGVVDSIDENLEFFSEDGRPLRASISLSLSSQKIQFQYGKQQSSGLAGEQAPGTKPQTQARQGDSVQKIAGQQGRQNDWKAIAAKNNIENPRLLLQGRLLDLE